MKITQIFKKIVCAALSAAVTLSSTPLPASAEDGDIGTAQQLTQFLSGCQSDEYSRGKSFVLLNDIDMKGREITQGAVFCGRLQGGGHRIYNFTIEVSSNEGGFFGEIGEDGAVSDLVLEGEIRCKELSDDDKTVDAEEIIDDIRRNIGASGVRYTEKTQPAGGVAGVNKGRLYGCSFEGTVEGKKNIGGIAGENSDTGIIESCTNKGEISGIENIGGIAGENKGIIRSCANEGEINKAADASAVNTGGIAGDSSGVLEGCANTGSVGCSGYAVNTGGIAGRQSGCILGCENQGTVEGKKNTGGIAGLFSPYTDIDADMDGVRDEIDKQKQELEDEYNKLNDDIKNDVDEIKDSLDIFSIGRSNSDSITQGSREVLDSVADYIDKAAENSGSTSEAGRELIDSISGFVDDSKSLKDNIKTVTDSLDKNLTSLADSIDAVSSGSEETKRHIESFMDTISESISSSSGDNAKVKDSLSAALDRIDLNSNALDDLADSVDSTLNVLERTLRSLDNNSDNISDSITAPLNLLYRALKSVYNEIEDRKERLEKIKDKIEELGSDIEDLINGYNDGWEIIPNDNDYGEIIPSDNEGTVEIPNENDDSSAQEEEIKADEPNAASLFGKITAFLFPKVQAEELKGLSEIFDTDAIKEEMKKVISVDVALDRNVAGEYFDNAIIQNSSNTGLVNGVGNSGGIVGTMGVEKLYTDGETITLPGGKPVISDITMKAVINSCVSDGKVSAKDDACGGIVGLANMGIIKNCLGAGELSADSGCGAVGGDCLATVLYSIGAARVDAKDYAGGIAGKGGNIHQCYSISVLDANDLTRAGAIAGSIEGSAKNNCFIDEGIGGIGGVSYVGNAQPLKFEKMISSDKLPQEMDMFFNDDWYVESGDLYFPQIPALVNSQGFNSEMLKAKSAKFARTHFDVSFVIDGETVENLVKEYDQELNADEIPKIPKKDGKYPYWDRDVSEPIRRHTVFEAVYGEAVTTIASEEDPPLILLQGLFSENTRVTVKEISCGEAFDGYNTGKAYSFSITPEADGEDGFTLRVLDKDGNGSAIALINDKTVIKAKRDGSYLVCEMEAPADFAILEKPAAGKWIIAAICAAGAAVIFILLFIIIKRKKLFTK